MFLVCVCPPLCLTAYVLYVCCVIWALLSAINSSFVRSNNRLFSVISVDNKILRDFALKQRIYMAARLFIFFV